MGNSMLHCQELLTSRKCLKLLVVNDEGEDSCVISNVVYKEIFKNVL